MNPDFFIIGSDPELLLAIEYLLGERSIPSDIDNASCRRHSWAILQAAMDQAVLPQQEE